MRKQFRFLAGVPIAAPVRPDIFVCGIIPKVLQRLLGHSSIKTTMDRYVHVTDASLTNAVKQFEQSTTMVS